ncbi:hypothetical protein WJX75_007166 [Coccomyxa subellipsoidea]|uniref:Uncharacterized protein n=1 Tax=Coccomyxa subellipsoidea TaxID=248742 RepID=A0ABR2YVU2_9CHLO
MLKEVDVQLYVMKRLSMDRLSAAIMRVHAENGCSEPLSWDTFRKRLGQATQQLGYILQRCDDMKGLGAEDYPSGLLAECGGCWTAAEADQARNGPLARLHSVYIDWCFKIPHLKAADRSGERHAYATLFLKKILEQGIAPQFVCVECQRLSSSVRMIGAGRGNGEPHENFNAEFGPQGRVLQYMTRQNREWPDMLGDRGHDAFPSAVTHSGGQNFEALLATFVQQKVLHLQLEIERMVRVRMDADALMPALAERPADQARLKKTLLRSASAIDSKAARLKMWVTGSFVREAMLAEEVRALRETAPAWDIGTFRHGVFPWDRDDFADSESSRAQLVSRLVLHSREKRRCKEELELLQREKQSTLQLYEKQTAALRGGLAAIERDLAALQPAAAFGSTDMSQALRQADQCALDFVECVPECVEAEDGTVLVVADAEEGLSSDDDAP